MSSVTPILPVSGLCECCTPSTSPGWFYGAGLGGLSGDCKVLETCLIPRSHPDPLRALQSTITSPQPPGSDSPSGCGWAILLSYELGGLIEPKAGPVHQLPGIDFPAIVVQRLGEPLHDPRTGSHPPAAFALGSLHSSMGRAHYIESVERVRAYIAAGDIYQANIAHHLHTPFRGHPHSCALALLHAAQPRYGAAMSFAYQGLHHTICSLSPELFLSVDASGGVIRTEPMKGTRPINADQTEFEHCPKDRAELNMITDLMRNDLGRVCTPGSVRVTQARKIEAHADSVLQASSIVQGTLRDSMELRDLIVATFPPGSVTGAPKVRAMQIIDELEQRPRNAYCGSLLTIDCAGNITASVCIRTAHIWGEKHPNNPELLANGHLVYPVGAGIVADSDPASEWEETQVKAAVLRSALHAWLSKDDE